jgi:hypothetical protein
MPAVTPSEISVQNVLSIYHSASEDERKKDVERRISHYRDDYYTYISDLLYKQFAKDPANWMKPLIDDSLNVYKFVINQLYDLYRTEPIRKVGNGTENDPVWQAIVDNLQYDCIMDLSQKLAGAATGVVIYVVPWEKKIRLDVITPDKITVIQNPDNPSEAVAVIFEVNLEDTSWSPMVQATPVSNSTGAIGEKLQYYIYWDVFGRHMLFDNHLRTVAIPDNPDNINPFKDPTRPGRTILPMVICTPTYVDQAIWDKTTGKNLVSAQEQIGIYATLLNYYTKMQSFKQPYITGNVDVQMSDDVILDPSTVLKALGDGAQIGVLDMQGDLIAFSKNLDNKIERALNQEGLSLEDFKQTGDAPSGYARRIKRLPLEEFRARQEKIWRVYEKELFEVIRIVNNASNTAKISETAEFSIVYSGEMDIASIQEQVTKDTWDIANNVRSIVEIIAERFNISREEALVRLTQNQADNKIRITPVVATNNLENTINQLAE